MPPNKKTVPLKVSPQASVAGADDTCAALDASGRLCNALTKEGGRWCPRHDKQRIKLYVNYKAYHAALDAFPERSICHTHGAIQGCTSLEKVRAWNKALLTKYGLLNRCISARAYFTERFFGNDMDFGHKTFWHFLIKQLHKTEALLIDVEQRACELVLEAQNALWVLKLQADFSGLQEKEECSGHEEGIFPALRPAPPSPTDTGDIEDPLDVALREKCAVLWEKIRTRLARYCAPVGSRFYDERIAVIHGCVRRAIYTDAKLLVVAQNYESVVALLTDTTLDVRIVDKLWYAIRSMWVYEVRAAIDDVVRPADGPGEYVAVLGGRVYKDLSDCEFKFHFWGHMTAVFRCYSCVRRVCKSVEEIVTLTRFAVLTATGLSQGGLKYDLPYESSKILSLSGFIPNGIDAAPPRAVVSKCNCVLNGAPHWEETRVSYVLGAGLPLGDPKAHAFVNACLRDPALMVLTRKGKDAPVVRSTTRIWAERVRQASTRAGLRAAAWDARRAMYYRDSVLEAVCPRAAETVVFEDCFQVVLVDGGDGSMAEFVKRVSEIWLEVYGVRDTMALMGEVATPFVEGGELEVNYHGRSAPATLVANIEEDVLAAYKRLWGSAPAELLDEDRLEQMAAISKK